jgi:hypothetical protein
MEQQIIEGNKLILQYEGLNPEIKHRGVLPKYHESWDRLMPVLMKILDENSSCCHFAPSHFFGSIVKGKWDFSMLDDQTNSEQASNDNPILAVWQCVVSYLKSK